MRSRAARPETPRSSRRTRRLGVVLAATAALGAVPLSAAHAQGQPVGGGGQHFFLAGAGNTSGVATEDFFFGDRGDEVFLGDFDGNGRDDVMARRGNVFFVRSGPTFAYGNPGDVVLVGDWDGDGADSLAVRRGRQFFVKNAMTTGRADLVFEYGDPGDVVLVGNWDGDTSAAGAPATVTTDTLVVRRGDRYFVKNTTTTGIADYDFLFGAPGDAVLVGDWATAPSAGVAGESGDYADQLAVRRGNAYFLSDEVWRASSRRTGYGLATRTAFLYGEPTDTAFSALLERRYTSDSGAVTLYGDGLGVRRNA